MRRACEWQVKREREALLSQCGLQGSSDACILIMVQRLAPEKDTAHALEALLKLAEEGEGSRAGGKISLDGARPVHLVVAGDGPSKKALEAYAQKHVLPVTFLGNLPNDRLPPLYRAADCFVTCSTSETYGLTVLEALACGTPAVLPHCAVFDELWEGKVRPPSRPPALPPSRPAPSSTSCGRPRCTAAPPPRDRRAAATDPTRLDLRPVRVRPRIPSRVHAVRGVRSRQGDARLGSDQGELGGRDG